MSLSGAPDASKACFSWRSFGSSCVTVVSSLISVRSHIECTVSSRSMGYLLGFYEGRGASDVDGKGKNGRTGAA